MREESSGELEPVAKKGSDPLHQGVRPLFCNRLLTCRIRSVRGARCMDQFLDRYAQQFRAAKDHAECTYLACVDLVLRATVEAADLARTGREFPGDASDLLLGNVTVIPV